MSPSRKRTSAGLFILDPGKPRFTDVLEFNQASGFSYGKEKER
jgi:hypothetical protein